MKKNNEKGFALVLSLAKIETGFPYFFEIS